ncbi:MAG: hypothetical protein ABI574_13265 [Burkholderiales bacterium]
MDVPTRNPPNHRNLIEIEMPVTKTTRECYEVRSDGPYGEWANIMLHCWERRANVGTKHEGVYYCGEIAIHSSFGSWGCVWTACAVPFKQFLMRAEFDYVFTKFMGTKLERHDGPGAMKQIKRHIVHERRMGDLDKEQARDAWDLVMGESDRIDSDDSTAFGYAMLDIGSRIDEGHPLSDYFNDPSGWPLATKPDSQAAGFWRELWPPFIEALKAEQQELQPA